MVKSATESGNAIILNDDISHSITNSFIKELLEKIELVKENDLSFSFDHWIELIKKKSSQEGNIDLNTLRDSNSETLLCLLIRNRTLWNLLSQQDRDLLIEKLDINYTYIGPFDKTKQKIQFDNYLHIAARVRNIDAFLFIFKKSIENNIRLLEYNENHENPFHVAAKTRILPAVVKGMFEHLQSEVELAEASILETKEAGGNPKEKLEKLESFKETVKSEISSIKYALYDTVSTDKKGLRPVDWISGHLEKEIRKEILRVDNSIGTRAYFAGVHVRDKIESTIETATELRETVVEEIGQCRIL